MDPFFFRVDHHLLRSTAFQDLGGSAVKVYLVIGLYADFGTDWAYPSIRTIARQAGLSRQTVLAAIADLSRSGILATSKSPGRSTAYKIIRQAPSRPDRKRSKTQPAAAPTGPLSLEALEDTVPESLGEGAAAGPISCQALAQFLDRRGLATGPKREPETRETDISTSIEIPGTPFRLASDGRLLVSVDLQELLTSQGIPRQLAEKLAGQKDPESVAKVLLNALYLQSQGKLQNGPGYIRAGIEDGYDLLPQIASRLERRRRDLEAQMQITASRRERMRAHTTLAAEEAAIDARLRDLAADELQTLLCKALAALPQPLVRRNPTLSNPFVRAKVYELSCGKPAN